MNLAIIITIIITTVFLSIPVAASALAAALVAPLSPPPPPQQGRGWLRLGLPRGAVGGTSAAASAGDPKFPRWW